MKSRLGQKAVVSIIALDPFKIGGLETYARELSRQLGELGWRSVLCFLAPPPGPVRRYFDLPNVTLETVGRPFNRWLTRILGRYRPRILHLHLTSMMGPYAWLARIYGVNRIFFTDHSSRPQGFVATGRPPWKRLVFRTLMAPLTRVVCVSDYVRDSLDGLKLLPQGRTAVIYNGIDIARIAAARGAGEDFRRRYGVPADGFLIVQVGQVMAEKGVDDFLESARRVVAVNSRASFAAVGDGDRLAEYRDRARRLGLGNRVVFTGPLSDPVTAGVYDAADLVCLMSRWEEAFGLVIAEAMAAARPVLATRVGAIPELVADGVTGFTVARGDVGTMAERMLRLAGDPGLRQRLGAAGLNACREKFDHGRNVTRLLELYGISAGPEEKQKREGR